MLARGFGSGLSPFAPGTAGSVVGLGWALAVASVPGPTAGRWAMTALAALIAIPICTRACRLLGSKDPGEVVLDEIVAVPIVFWCGALPMTLPWLAAGFIVFRIMDVLKPPPARQLEHMAEGTGIVADDLVAGLYAAIVLWAIQLALAQWGSQPIADVGDLLSGGLFG